MRFSVKITSSCIWVAIPVYWVILHWYACGGDERSVSPVYSHEITKHLSDGWWAPGWVMGRLPHFLRYGATLACVELGYRTKGQFLGEHHVVWTGKKVSSLAVVARTDCMMIGRGIEFSQGHAAKNQPMAVRNIITKQFIIIPCTQIYLFSCYQNMKY